MTTLTAQLAVAKQRRFGSASWLVLGVVGLLTAASLLVTVAILAQPGDGCMLDTTAIDIRLGACVGGWPTPVRSGDLVVSVEGIAQELEVSIRQPAAPAAWVDGGTARYIVERGGNRLALDVPLQRMGPGAMLRAFGYGLVTQWPFWHLFALLGALVIFALRPRERAAQLFLLAIGGLCAVIVPSAPANTVGVAFAPAALWYWGLFLNLCWGWLFMPTMLLLVLSFPRRVWPLARYPRLTPALIYGLPLAATLVALATGAAPVYLVALGLGALGVVVASVAVTLHTWLRVRDAVIRAQTAWLAFGIAVGLAFWPVNFVLGSIVPGWEQSIEQLPRWLALPLVLLPTLAFPLCLGIAITRYRLFDIDLVVNRALVYAALTACVVGLYILIVGYLGWLFRGTQSLAFSLVATGVVAVAFAPLRGLLQRGVNRLMYGERDEPYRVLTRLGQQLEHTLDQSTALARTVETVARALKLPYVAIALEQDGRRDVVAAYGRAAGPISHVPLVYAGAPIGELIVAPRAHNERLTPADERLLHDLARQIGVAAHAVLLAATLERARVRLVTERGEARRRLGSDLHDSVGHRLAGLTRQTERVLRTLPDDPALARQLLADSTRQLAELSGQVRALAHQLWPPELELLGLTGALRERAQTYDGLRVELDAPAQLPALPAEIQAAAYLIALEALTNVEKHAQAQACRLRLHLSQPDAHTAVLELEVVDDGRGLAADHAGGLGLLSMQARAAEVGGSCSVESLAGGGSAVRVRIPCPPDGE